MFSLLWLIFVFVLAMLTIPNLPNVLLSGWNRIPYCEQTHGFITGVVRSFFTWLWMISLFLSFSAEWDCGEVEGMDSGTAYDADKQVQRGTEGWQDSRYVTIQLHSSIPTEKRQAQWPWKSTLTKLFYCLKMNSHVSELTCHTCVKTHVIHIYEHMC